MSNIFYWTFLVISANIAILVILDARNFNNYLKQNKTLVWCAMCILMITSDFFWHLVNLYIFEILCFPSMFAIVIATGICFVSALFMMPIYGLLYIRKWKLFWLAIMLTSLYCVTEIMSIEDPFNRNRRRGTPDMLCNRKRVDWRRDLIYLAIISFFNFLPIGLGFFEWLILYVGIYIIVLRFDKY